jgi:hypothetical protein
MAHFCLYADERYASYKGYKRWKVTGMQILAQYSTAQFDTVLVRISSKRPLLTVSGYLKMSAIFLSELVSTAARAVNVDVGLSPLIPTGVLSDDGISVGR